MKWNLKKNVTKDNRTRDVVSSSLVAYRCATAPLLIQLRPNRETLRTRATRFAKIRFSETKAHYKKSQNTIYVQYFSM